MSAIQKMNNFAQHGQNATRHVAEAVLDGQEKLLRSQLDAFEEFLRQSAQQVRDGLAGMKQPTVPENWPQAVMDSIQRGTAFNLGYVEIARNLQQDMALALEEGLRAMRDGSMEVVDQWSDAATLFPAEIFRPLAFTQQQAA